MKLLSIIEFGFLGLSLITIALLGLAAVFIYRAYKAHNSGSTIQTNTPAGTIESTVKVPYWKIHDTYFAAVFIGFWVFFLLSIKSNYREYDPKKDGVPQEQTDTTRQAAEEMIKK
jgi:quinol-cytochrome oxidoreductase complex cytochrome b subunit